MITRSALQGGHPVDQRAVHLLNAAAALARCADADPTVAGATISLPGGETLFLTVHDALAMIGLRPAAGTA